MIEVKQSSPKNSHNIVGQIDGCEVCLIGLQENRHEGADFLQTPTMNPAARDSVPQMQFLLPDLATMLDARQPLYRLAQTIGWTQFEAAFAKLYKD